MVSQRAGQVIMYNLETAEKICYLNQKVEKWPLKLQEKENYAIFDSYNKQFKKQQESGLRFRNKRATTVAISRGTKPLMVRKLNSEDYNIQPISFSKKTSVDIKISSIAESEISRKEELIAKKMKDHVGSFFK